MMVNQYEETKLKYVVMKRAHLSLPPRQQMIYFEKRAFRAYYQLAIFRVQVR